MLYWRGNIYYCPNGVVSLASRRIESSTDDFYFLRAFGARCDSALAAAIFAGFELFWLFSTEEAALAARALVLR